MHPPAIKALTLMSCRFTLTKVTLTGGDWHESPLTLLPEDVSILFEQVAR